VVLSPVLGAIAFSVWLCLGAPVVFTQRRPGLAGKPFKIFKFRTMTLGYGPDGELLADAERLTAFGRFLRQTSLDELPELLNVVMGEMSLVGPRPLLMRYYPYFTSAERARFLVRPGITGLSQIDGRNDLSWDQRIRRDIEYVSWCSPWLDLCILCLTFWRVITRSGLRADPGTTMLDFDEERRRAGQSITEGAP
jgi:lipopolysaccharide/colanic/teichoic acid biosynthesis glycosyltransferase